jgi:hypothetical protein
MLGDFSLSAPWRRFLFRLLPGTTLGLALLAELLAFAADPIPYRRHDLDRLALAVELDKDSPERPLHSIIIGDSVTQDVLKTYTIGGDDNVTDLTTNMASGLAGSYLLMKRFLDRHAPPRHLVIAATPEFFTYLPEGEAARIYLRTVFRNSDEVDFLGSYLPAEEAFFMPAALEMDERLGKKFLALLAPSPSAITMGARAPDPGAQVAMGIMNNFVRDDVERRGRHTLAIPEQNALVFRDMCRLAEQYDFSIHFQIAPLPRTVYSSWQQSGVLSSFEADVSRLFESECQNTKVFTDYEISVVPDVAMRDADHLVRHDWTNFYAVLLNDLILSLD